MPLTRVAAPEDLPMILRLLSQLPLTRTDESSLPDETRATKVWKQILETPGRTMIVAETDGEIVGAVDLLTVLNLTHRGAPWAIVENLIVDKRHRRQGIGRSLMEEAIKRAKDAGCYKVQLLSNRARTEAHTFYGSLGFEPNAEGFRLYFDES